jgi:hypothetical protein
VLGQLQCRICVSLGVHHPHRSDLYPWHLQRSGGGCVHGEWNPVPAHVLAPGRQRHLWRDLRRGARPGPGRSVGCSGVAREHGCVVR